MASLNPQQSRGGRGAPFDEGIQNNNDETSQDSTQLIAISENPYRHIRTTAFIIIHIILTILIEVVIVALPILCDKTSKPSFCPNHSSYNIALYVHAGTYFINVIFDRIYHYHQDLSRLDGYLDFYRRTRNLRRTPLIVTSTGNAILVAMIKLLEDYQDKIKPLDPKYCLTILTSLEVIVILICLICYLVITVRFNKKCARPDATHEDFLSTFITPLTSINEVGFRDETYREDVLGKQADLIRYLRERNAHLSRLIVQLKQQTDHQQIFTNLL